MTAGKAAGPQASQERGTCGHSAFLNALSIASGGPARHTIYKVPSNIHSVYIFIVV